MGKIDSFKNCKDESSHQLELIKKQIDSSNSFKDVYTKMIKFNEICLNEGTLAITEADTLENINYANQVKVAIKSSNERIMAENKMYSLLLQKSVDSQNIKNNQDLSDQVQLISMILKEYVIPDEIKAWEGTVLVAEGKNLKDYEPNISVQSIFAFLIIFVLFYTYAKVKNEEKEENKNN